jgi:hypothetical protein
MIVAARAAAPRVEYGAEDADIARKNTRTPRIRQGQATSNYVRIFEKRAATSKVCRAALFRRRISPLYFAAVFLRALSARTSGLGDHGSTRDHFSGERTDRSFDEMRLHADE